jgi:hypothetical protein
MTTEEKKRNKQIVINNLQYFICDHKDTNCQDCADNITNEDRERWLEILSYFCSEGFPTCSHNIMTITMPFENYNTCVVKATYTGENSCKGIERFIAAKFYLAMYFKDINTDGDMYNFSVVKRCIENLNITIPAVYGYDNGMMIGTV